MLCCAADNGQYVYHGGGSWRWRSRRASRSETRPWRSRRDAGDAVQTVTVRQPVVEWETRASWRRRTQDKTSPPPTERSVPARGRRRDGNSGRNLSDDAGPVVERASRVLSIRLETTGDWRRINNFMGRRRKFRLTLGTRLNKKTNKRIQIQVQWKRVETCKQIAVSYRKLPLSPYSLLYIVSWSVQKRLTEVGHYEDKRLCMHA